MKAAATCRRFADVAAVARFLAVGEVAVVGRAVRAVLAASPREAAAFDDAARDAAVRLEGVGSSVSSPDAAGFTPFDSGDAPAAPVAPDFFAAAFAAVPSAAAAFAAVERGVFAGFVDFAPPDAADDVEAFARSEPVGAESCCSVSRAGRASEVPRSADTPVPVPSGASSSYSEGETEVTKTTYQ
ncbi:hypothetical protein [Agromyces bauzanensis]|uniref:hypothetical protein n=1 Tax=Agromyces bauzanensis TaxID=1308924 RepID=UPI001665B5CC|nr:hypothetical protein [Agromyces bauzanensis]